MAGHIGDQIGAKKLFQWGCIAFIAMSFCCGLSTSAWLLTIFRLLQGAAAAFIVPSSLALINIAFAENTARAKAIGIWAATGGIAAAAGPIAGAVLTTLFSWRAVFFVNIPIGLLCLFLTAKFIIGSKSEQKMKFDFAGQLFAVIWIAVLAFSLIEVGRLGWSSSVIIIGFCIFIISFIAFILIEARVKQPMLPLTFFQSKNFSAAIIVGILMNIAFYGELFILPLYFQQIRNYTVMMTGFALLPLMITVALSSYLSGKFLEALLPHQRILSTACTSP